MWCKIELNKLSQNLIHWIVFSAELFFLVGLFSCAVYSTESNPFLFLPHLKLHSCLKSVKECPGFDSSLHLRRGQEQWLSSALRWKTKGRPHCCPQLLHTSEKQQWLCLSLIPGRVRSWAPEPEWDRGKWRGSRWGQFPQVWGRKAGCCLPGNRARKG